MTTTPAQADTPESVAADLATLEEFASEGLVSPWLSGTLRRVARAGRAQAAEIARLHKAKEDANLAATGLRIKATQDRAKIDELRDMLQTTEQGFRACDARATQAEAALAASEKDRQAMREALEKSAAGFAALTSLLTGGQLYEGGKRVGMAALAAHSRAGEAHVRAALSTGATADSEGGGRG
ncbi:hypothetical protein J2847_006196 [Azospirillum agricola]|uniref:hypothetical protein n=1 Tax=Azospirillum agricola TaxID=1720247 RepID=UPI001AE9290F|nr:hypothetical protein [Azospirillum agricola]MBP2232862.1 hypothetical protein [Azospirillum agricola]